MPDAYVGFPDNSNDNAGRPPENGLPQDGATQPPQNNSVATQTVTVTYLATEGGRITDASIKSLYTKNYYISVDEEAFMDCVNLKTFVGSNYISKIGARAFKNCPNLKLILDPNVVIYN